MLWLEKILFLNWSPNHTPQSSNSVFSAADKVQKYLQGSWRLGTLLDGNADVPVVSGVTLLAVAFLNALVSELLARLPQGAALGVTRRTTCILLVKPHAIIWKSNINNCQMYLRITFRVVDTRLSALNIALGKDCHAESKRYLNWI